MSKAQNSPDNKKIKQPFSVVLKNNLYLLKLMLKASPAFVIIPALDAVRGQLSIFFEHTVGIGYVLEAAEKGYPFESVCYVILILAICITLGMLFTVFSGDYIMEKERPKVKEKIKIMLYEKASKVDLACYDDPEFYNSQVLALSEVDKQIDKVEEIIINVLSGITAFTSNGIYYIMKDKPSILFVIGSFVISYFFNQMFIKINYKARIERNPSERKRTYIERVFYLNDYAKELRMNPDVAGIMYNRFDKASEEIIKTDKKYTKKSFFIEFVRKHIANFFICDTLYITYLILMVVVTKSISISTLAILYNSFGRLKHSMNVFTETYPAACETSLYIQKIRDFMNTKPKIVSEEKLTATKDAKRIDLKDVSFAYSSKTPNVIENMNLFIKPGRKIALVGYNGAGKTTLVKLLMRLYDPTEGTVFADGTDIRKYDLESYRDSIGAVFQDFNIFAGSVRENVVLAPLEDSREDKIISALKDSGLYERVMKLEDKLDSMLTTEFDDKGLNLSGGEAQKLAISRVFYKDAGLMILDEPSSALDPIAEYQLNHAMLKATGDKTVIFISHRLSTTRIADHIFMLEKGRIVEEGNHEQLLALHGKYEAMWKAQAGAYIEV
ncbi:MAG: ABC transporter ATP-binding protein [Clostridiales bacterium]|nr:ABC transporter ATP-binding protein [Clostridiales bacterium]